jgi:hypothetical protein
MARPPAEDPLIPLPVRLPTSLVLSLKAQATDKGTSVSDVLRSHLTLEDAKPLGKPRPRRRDKKLGAVSGADPVLLREIAGIGNNMNQLARSVNAGLLSGTTIQLVHILSILKSIEQEIQSIGKRHAH